MVIPDPNLYAALPGRFFIKFSVSGGAFVDGGHMVVTAGNEKGR